MLQRNSLVRLGQGLPGRLSIAKSSEAKKAGATQHRPQQRSQSALSSRVMRVSFKKGVRPRVVGNRARARGQRLTLVLVADKEQVARLVGPAGDWNAWRAKNLKRRPDLRGADLRHADLRRADLRRADLSGSDLSRANLSD